MKEPIETDYSYQVTVRWTGIIPATSKIDAIEKVKSSFIDEYMIELENKEIKIFPNRRNK
jgi:hypothetical protein